MNEFLTLVEEHFFFLSFFLSRYLFLFDDTHIIQFDIHDANLSLVVPSVIFGDVEKYICMYIYSKWNLNSIFLQGEEIAVLKIAENISIKKFF